MSAFLSRPRIAVGVAILVCAMCIVAFINRWSLDIDEAATVTMAGLPVPEMLSLLRHGDAVFGLYYGLMHVWVLLGHSAVFLRSFSAIFALAALPVVYLIGANLLDSESAAWGTLLLATSFIFLRWGVIARTYSMEFFFCALSALALVRVVQQDHPVKHAWLYALWASLAIYAHPIAIAWALAHGISLLVIRDTAAARRLLMPAIAVIIVAVVPLALLTALNGGGNQIDWIPSLTPFRLGEQLNFLLGGGSGPFHLPTLLSCALIALAAIGFFSAERSEECNAARLLVTWVVGTILVVALISVLKPVYLAYYVRYVMIGVALLAGRGLTFLNHRTVAMTAPAVAVLFAAASLTQLSRTGVYEDWRSVAAYVASNVTQRDAIIIDEAYCTQAFLYALREGGHEQVASRIIYPLPTGVVENHNTAADRAPAYSRLWIVRSHITDLGAPDVPFEIRKIIASFPDHAVTPFHLITVDRSDR